MATGAKKPFDEAGVSEFRGKCHLSHSGPARCVYLMVGVNTLRPSHFSLSRVPSLTPVRFLYLSLSACFLHPFVPSLSSIIPLFPSLSCEGVEAEGRGVSCDGLGRLELDQQDARALLPDQAAWQHQRQLPRRAGRSVGAF